jgi:hypothetical protein
LPGGIPFAKAVDLGVAGRADHHQVVLAVRPVLADGHDVVQVGHVVVLRAQAAPVHRIHQQFVLQALGNSLSLCHLDL